MYKVYLSAWVKDKNFGVNNLVTKEFRMNQIVDVVETYLLQTGEFAVYRNVPGMTIEEVIKDSNDVIPNAHIVINSICGNNQGINCCVKVGDAISNGIGKEVYKQVINTYHNKNIDNGVIYDESVLEIQKVNSPAIKIDIGCHDNIKDLNWIVINVENIGRAIGIGIEKGLALKVC